ncbi:MAG: hypothetical protein C3F02_04850 [Parcubacteria group bacterium]|nr:MAG: hypothetical protein C3F02_04850 [Parcubacteria group bacterium]
MQLSIIIPAYNEAAVIAQTIAQVKKYLTDHYNSYEIIVIDDKSIDSTLEIIEGIDNIRVLRNLKNHGKGYTVRKGLLASQGDYLLFMDADSSTSISELAKLWPYRQDYPLVIGSRAVAQAQVKIRQNIVKVILGRAGNLLSRLLIHPNIKDTQCGFKLLARSARPVWEKLTIEDFGFDFEMIFLARKHGLAIKEVPIIWYNNFDSKVRWWHYPRTLAQLWQIRLNNLLKKY